MITLGQSYGKKSITPHFSDFHNWSPPYIRMFLEVMVMMGPRQILPLCTRVDLGVMAMKGYFILPWSSELVPCQILILCSRVDLGVMAMLEYSILPRSPELEPRRIQPLRIRVNLGVITLKKYSLLSRSPDLEPRQIQPLCIRVDLRVMAMKYSTFSRSLQLEHHTQMLFQYHTQDTNLRTVLHLRWGYSHWVQSLNNVT